MADRQRTLKNIAVIRGTAAFTGHDVTVEIHPADIGHGPSFELIQNGQVFPISVSVENIIETENRTVLARPDNNEIQINFVEHVLGALHGLGVDNALIKVNSVEIPLFDGSALRFITAIDEVGIIEQDADREELIIETPQFIDDNGMFLALPSDKLKLSYYLDHPNDFVGKRIAQIDVTPDNFRKRIGPARTFIKSEKVNDLIASGAVKNPDTAQVLIVFEDRTSQPLRFANEFCYHKMLDILGDLYLSGKRIRGHLIGIRSGHFQNRLMIRKLVAENLP